MIATAAITSVLKHIAAVVLLYLYVIPISCSFNHYGLRIPDVLVSTCVAVVATVVHVKPLYDMASG